MRKANMRHNMFPTMLGFASNYMRKHWLSINYLSIITTVILGFPTHMNESIISFILYCLQTFKSKLKTEGAKNWLIWEKIIFVSFETL